MAAATALATGPTSFYAIRLLLGIGEAGFFPGVIFFLAVWFPASYRTRVLAWFTVSTPLSSLIGGPLSTWLLQLTAYLGRRLEMDVHRRRAARVRSVFSC